MDTFDVLNNFRFFFIIIKVLFIFTLLDVVTFKLSKLLLKLKIVIVYNFENINF